MCGYVGQIKLTAKCSQEQFSLGYTYHLPSFPCFEKKNVWYSSCCKYLALSLRSSPMFETLAIIFQTNLCGALNDMCNLIVIPWFISVMVRTLWLMCSILVELVPS